MRIKGYIAFFFGCILFSFTFAQKSKVSGVVTGEKEGTIPGVTVRVGNTANGTITDGSGYFHLSVSNGENVLEFSHVQFEPFRLNLNLNGDTTLQIVLKERTTQLADIRVEGEIIVDDQIVTTHKIDSKAAKSLPSTFGDFNKILVTLPGVSSNNELSSAYSVRGGNFDENLVYVNDMPVYRPFLANAGRQEGLSFVNPDMVQDIEFYAGGWEPKYGDKLSSSLNIEYKEPDSLQGSVTVGLLGGTIFVGDKVGRMSYLVGARHRDSRYLLNTLEVSGQYFPTYSDIQSLLTFDLSGKNSSFINKTKLNVLFSYGRNRYLSEPQSQVTDFGSVQQNYRLQTAFIGREIMNYNTYQAGFRLTHRFENRLRTHLIGSFMNTWEREYYDVEGAYRLCDVNKNPGSSSFDECVIERGIGTNYEYGRNKLEANIATIESRWEFLLNVNHIVEGGAGVTFQDMNDHLQEYSFLDSSDYVRLKSGIFNDISLQSKQYYAYFQSTYLWKDSVHALSSGVRLTYWDYNGQGLISPRISYRWSPKWEKPTTLKLSAGLYQQPPFYRELRDQNGQIHQNVYAQKSVHLIAAYTRVFKMWDRSFMFTSDAYHKQMWDLIPYDIDNVRLRYYPGKTAVGYARGLDFRVHGEFVKGTQSWISLGFLQTRENIAGDTYTKYLNADGNEIFPNAYNKGDIVDEQKVEVGYVRRPMDQRINLAAYFEDHMPKDPSLRVYLNMVIGSGYPFGPPGSVRYRNAFSGDEYYRVDIGFSKMFEMQRYKRISKAWIRVEVLNALGADNTLSYSWIEDVNGYQFAVPNSLSARFFNVKLSADL